VAARREDADPAALRCHEAHALAATTETCFAPEKHQEGRHIETDTNAWTAVAKAAGGRQGGRIEEVIAALSEACDLLAEQG
jgi:hypothetical protein